MCMYIYGIYKVDYLDIYGSIWHIYMFIWIYIYGNITSRFLISLTMYSAPHPLVLCSQGFLKTQKGEGSDLLMARCPRIWTSQNRFEKYSESISTIQILQSLQTQAYTKPANISRGFQVLHADKTTATLQPQPKKWGCQNIGHSPKSTGKFSRIFCRFDLQILGILGFVRLGSKTERKRQ